MTRLWSKWCGCECMVGICSGGVMGMWVYECMVGMSVCGWWWVCSGGGV